jgi:hypothetical protein
MIKLDRFDTHDRFLDYKKQNFNVDECIQDLINQRPFGNHPFYIFAHARTHENGADQRYIWQPRLTRPLPQSNSSLYKAYPGSDKVIMCWIIPKREYWDQYKKGNVTENAMIEEFIHIYMNNRKLLEQPEDDDLSDAEINAIYVELSAEAKRKKQMEKLWITPKI